MKAKLWLIGFLLFPVLLQAQIQYTPLESYDFDVGDSGADEFLFHDSSVGTAGGNQAMRVSGGYAQLRFHLFRGAGDETDLRIQIFRHHKKESISFALLLERVEIIFSGANGNVLKKIVLDQKLGDNGLFIIDDSNDGYFEHLTKIPNLTGLKKLQIRVFGNYE